MRDRLLRYCSGASNAVAVSPSPAAGSAVGRPTSGTPHCAASSWGGGYSNSPAGRAVGRRRARAPDVPAGVAARACFRLWLRPRGRRAARRGGGRGGTSGGGVGARGRASRRATARPAPQRSFFVFPKTKTKDGHDRVCRQGHPRTPDSRPGRATDQRRRLASAHEARRRGWRGRRSGRDWPNPPPLWPPRRSALDATDTVAAPAAVPRRPAPPRARRRRRW